MDDEKEEKGEGRHRVQLDFSEEAFAILAEVREMSGARTNAAVMRNALRLYRWLLGHQQKGNQLQVREGDIIKDVEILF